LSLGLSIYVVDQVKFEVTKDERFEDAKCIEEFVDNHPGVVHWFVAAMVPSGRSASAVEVVIEALRRYAALVAWIAP
jgi:hypothetical protein